MCGGGRFGVSQNSTGLLCALSRLQLRLEEETSASTHPAAPSTQPRMLRVILSARVILCASWTTSKRPVPGARRGRLPGQSAAFLQASSARPRGHAPVCRPPRHAVPPVHRRKTTACSTEARLDPTVQNNLSSVPEAGCSRPVRRRPALPLCPGGQS
eukprot:15356546-Alexandrium_andersonii.AAC.1